MSSSRSTLLALGCFALLPLPSQAERLGFKGMELGAPLARIASDPRHECRPVNTPIGDTICSLRAKEVETIAGAPVLSLHYLFDLSSLTSVQITVAEKDFQKVTDALNAKYGAGNLVSEPLRNLAGVSHENRTWSWKRPEGSLQAQRYSGRLDRSEIRFRDDAALLRIQKRRAVKDPLKDL